MGKEEISYTGKEVSVPESTPPYPYDEEGIVTSGLSPDDQDVFGNEEGHAIKYKTLSWQLVVVLMIAEIVSNGMLCLPSSPGVVGASFGPKKYILAVAMLR